MSTPLRVCRYCGLEAKTKEGLRRFIRRSDSKHGYLNLCKQCKKRLYKENRMEQPPDKKFRLNWNHFYKNTFAPLRKCNVCGLEVYSIKDLEKFVGAKKAKHGYMNRCRKCQNTIVSEQIRVKRKNNSFWGKFQTLSSSSSRRKSKAKGRTFDLTWEYLEKLAEEQNYCCALTGIPLKRKNLGGKRHYNAPSVDRIDNSRGYEEGNVRWTSQWANLARNDYGDRTFYTMCKKTSEFNPKLFIRDNT